MDMYEEIIIYLYYTWKDIAKDMLIYYDFDENGFKQKSRSCLPLH